jgi:hypothetical protein
MVPLGHRWFLSDIDVSSPKTDRLEAKGCAASAHRTTDPAPLSAPRITTRPGLRTRRTGSKQTSGRRFRRGDGDPVALRDRSSSGACPATASPSDGTAPGRAEPTPILLLSRFSDAWMLQALAGAGSSANSGQIRRGPFSGIAATRGRRGRPLVPSSGSTNSRSRRASPLPECLQEGCKHSVLVWRRAGSVPISGPDPLLAA